MSIQYFANFWIFGAAEPEIRYSLRLRRENCTNDVNCSTKGPPLPFQRPEQD